MKHWPLHLGAFAAWTITRSFLCAGSWPSVPAMLVDAVVYGAVIAILLLAKRRTALQRLREQRELLLAETAAARERLRRFRLPAEVILGTLGAIEERLDPALIQHFAKLMRRLLDAVRKERWSLDEELELAGLLVRLWRAKARSSVHLVVEETEPMEVEPGTVFAPLLERLRDDTTRVIVTGVQVTIEPESTAGVAQTFLSAQGQTGMSVPHAPAWETAAVIALALAILIPEQIARSGMNAIAFALPLLRVALWLTPLFFTRRPLVLAIPGAILGESAFFAFVAAMWPGAVPPFFSIAMAKIIGSSLVLPVTIALAAGALLRWRVVERDRLREQLLLLEQQRDLDAAKLELLQRQLQPHFLFNSLTSLSALAAGDPPRARIMAARLRAFYGRAASRDENPLIEMRQELELIREYLEIERVRFGARLEIDLDVDPACGSTLVPPLLLQPLAENAVKYGVASRSGSGWIRIAARRAGDAVHVVVQNSRGQDGSARDGFGLRNARERLAHAFGDRAALQTSADGSGSFAVSIRIPATMPA